MDEIENKVNKVLLRIRDERKKQNLSQMQLAAKADIAQSFYSGIESLQNVPTLTTLYKIAQALGISANKLLEDINLDKEERKNMIIELLKDL